MVVHNGSKVPRVGVMAEDFERFLVLAGDGLVHVFEVEEPAAQAATEGFAGLEQPLGNGLVGAFVPQEILP